MATATTCSRLLILPPSPASPAAASLQHRPPASTLRLSCRRRRSPRFTARAAPPVAPAAASTEEDKEKGRGEGLSPADAARLADFLRADLPHLFDDVGIDRTAYDDRVRFRDPITRHDTIDGYLFNIRLLKLIFRPDFYLHSVEQTGPYELTTRWTMVMKFMLLPWKPELVFTGLSIMGVNPQNLKFNSHVDLWDSIQNNEYFSYEGLWDVFKQLRIYKTPDIETPKYLILKRTANYEVRSYAPFLVVESKGDKLTGSSGFNNVTGYIFGKNASSEKIPMTTPVFTQTYDDKLSDVSIQIVLPMNKDLDSLPAPNTEAVTFRKVDGGIAAVKKFSGRPKEEVVLQKEKDLRSQLLKDGLKPQQGCLLARYNDPRTQSFLMERGADMARQLHTGVATLTVYSRYVGLYVVRSQSIIERPFVKAQNYENSSQVVCLLDQCIFREDGFEKSKCLKNLKPIHFEESSTQHKAKDGGGLSLHDLLMTEIDPTSVS